MNTPGTSPESKEPKSRETQPATCCTTRELASCCEPSAKGNCCGPRAENAEQAPVSCGCR